MKKIPYPLLVLIIFLSGCHYTQKSDAVLRQTETLLVEFPDSALNVLENLYPGKDFDKYNRSLYYVLLTEARNKKGISLIESDSLIDYALKNINFDRYPALSAKAYLFKGRIQNELQEPDQAVTAFLKGISLLEKTDKDPTVLSKLYDELGITYLDEFKSGKALEAFWKEYEIDRAIGDPRGIAFSLRNIGSVYLFREEPDSAFRYFDEALEYAGQSRDSVYLSDYIYSDIAIRYFGEGKYEEALLEHNKIKYLHANDTLSRCNILIHLGQADSARILLSELVCSNDIFIRCTANEYLSEIAESENDFEAALQYQKEYFSIFSDIIEQSRATDIRIIDHKHNWETAASKLKNLYRQRLNFIAFSFLFIVGFFFYRNRKRKAEKDKWDKEIANLRTEIALSENIILKLQHANEENLSLLEEKKEERKKLVDSLLEIEKTGFMKKKIYNRILKIAPSKNTPKKNASSKFVPNKMENLNRDERNKLISDVKESFAGTIKQKQQDNPEESMENIVAYCLRKSGFTSDDVGWFLNKAGSTIRHKTTGIV